MRIGKSLVVLLVLVAAAAAGYLWLRGEFLSPGPAASASRIEVEPGASVRTVLARLETAGAVRDARAVAWTTPAWK